VCFNRSYQSNYKDETYGKSNAVSGIRTRLEVGPVAHGGYGYVLMRKLCAF